MSINPHYDIENEKRKACIFNIDAEKQSFSLINIDKDIQIQQLSKENAELKRQIEELKRLLEPKKEVKQKIDMTVMANSYNEFSLTVDSMMKHTKKDKKRLKQEKKTGDFCSFLDNLDELCN